MRWGTELWDRFEDISNHVHKGLDFCEKYEDFWKKRCSIENSYAKSLRKLIEAHEPKKKDLDDSPTYMQCFDRMLSETRDIAGQHELIAENVQERVLGRLNLVVKTLKDERRKCIEDKDKHLAEHMAYDELMDKCRVKYEKSFREMQKADEMLNKVENDDSASKNDIKKQKSVCEQKKRHFDAAEADYGKQLYEANRAKNAYYTEQLPAVFDALQSIEQRRLLQFKQCVAECANIELEVVPRISKCLSEIEAASHSIDCAHDSDMLVSIYKTGYSIPADHVFEDLKQTKSKDNRSMNTISLNQTNLSNNSNSSSSSISNTQTINRHKKYRTLNRIKGLFAAAGALNRADDTNELPPAQMKNDLLKKIAAANAEIDKQQKEREGLLKLKDIYSTNEKFGDSNSAEQALRNNDQKLDNLRKQLVIYEDMLVQAEQSLLQAQSSVYHQYDCSSSSSSGTLSKHQHIYQSPSRASVTSVGSSAPPTPVTHKQCDNAYAVSGVGMAPLVSSNNSESFDDEDDDENYDSPSADHVDHVYQTDVEGLIGTALVMYSFDGNVQNSISIDENESLNVLERDSGDGWTLVQKLNGDRGYVPTDYIQIVYY